MLKLTACISILMKYASSSFAACPTTPNYLISAPAPGSNGILVNNFNGPITTLRLCDSGLYGFLHLLINDITSSCTAACSLCYSTPNGLLTLNAGEKILRIETKYLSDKVMNSGNTNTDNFL
jgi:hypothetical protein